ncbi:hypothetical protein [Streptomyces sp. NBRC 110028]|uniref:hypothetical protein n=1 Tax=Streptomyces sp. NBRC 110028 TaxID=1621260 RepID=UPI000B298346|nr:hypothetical protein [Streptomyces sp. NBRC 110028]
MRYRSESIGDRIGRRRALLPQLIRDARAAARGHHGGDQAAAYAVLAEAYQVAATTLTALGREDAAFTAMERAVEAAGRSDDPHLASIGASTLAWIFTRQGRLEDAERVALTHADRMDPGFHSRPVELSLWGTLLLRAATAVVRQGESKYDRVEELLRLSPGAAASIGTDRLDYATPFSPTNAGAIAAARTVPDIGSLPHPPPGGPGSMWTAPSRTSNSGRTTRPPEPC